MKILALVLAVGVAALSAQDAERLLLSATSFDDVAVGYAGETPAAVHAYRALLRVPDGVQPFTRIVEQGTPAGKLYALCGLFFLNPTAFDRQLAHLQRSRAPVVRTDGCIVSTTTMREVLARDERAPVMLRGGSLAQWNKARVEWLDLAGGSTCYRLRYDSVSALGQQPSINK